jgi:hypothetical protein
MALRGYNCTIVTLAGEARPRWNGCIPSFRWWICPKPLAAIRARSILVATQHEFYRSPLLL